MPDFAIHSAPTTKRGKKVLIYGPGGVGKTTLASMAPGPVVFIDLEGGTDSYDMPRLLPPGGEWSRDLVLKALRSDALHSARTIIIDTATKLEELCEVDVLDKFKIKGSRAESLEDYGFGKGYKFLFQQFLEVMAATEPHIAAGRNVVWIAHESVTKAVNPVADDWQRYEPRLFTPGNGKSSSSIRSRLKEDVSEVWFVTYAVNVDEYGKASGGARVIHTQETPAYIAKTRVLRGMIPFREGDATIWQRLFATPNPRPKEAIK